MVVCSTGTPLVDGIGLGTYLIGNSVHDSIKVDFRKLNKIRIHAREPPKTLKEFDDLSFALQSVTVEGVEQGVGNSFFADNRFID